MKIKVSAYDAQNIIGMKYIINTYREVLLEECNRHQTPCAGVSNIVIILIVQARYTDRDI